MSELYNVRTYLRMATDFEHWAARELQRVESELEELRETLSSAEKERDAELSRLCSIFVTGLDMPALRETARMTGFRLWLPHDPIAKREENRKQLQEEIARIERSEQYKRRDELAHPSTGTLVMELEQLEEELSPMADFLRKIEHPRLKHLVTAKYGTSQYAERWWRQAFYRDWEAADEIVERFPDYGSGENVFQELVEIYKQFEPAAAELRRRREALNLRLDEIWVLEHKRKRAVLDLETIEERHLGMVRAQLGEHLATLPADMLGTRLAGFPEHESIAKRWMGLAQKARYANEMIAEVERYGADIKRRVFKTERDKVKFLRPKHSGKHFTRAEVDARVGIRSERSDKYWARMERGHRSMRDFNDYDSARWSQDFLWWDLMTDAAPTPINSVRTFYDTHPGYSWKSSDARAAVAIAGAPEREFSSLDPS